MTIRQSISATRTRSAQDKYNPIRQVHIFDETQHVYLQNKLGSHCHIWDVFLSCPARSMRGSPIWNKDEKMKVIFC